MIFGEGAIERSLAGLGELRPFVRRVAPEVVLRPIWGPLLSREVVRELWLRALEDYDTCLAEDLWEALGESGKAWSAPNFGRKR